MASELHVVTVATESKYYFPYLLESCRRNNQDLEILGFGEKWQGFVWRYTKIIEYLHTLPCNDIVCIIDGYDVICTRDLHELMPVFISMKNKYKCKVVVGQENVASYVNLLSQYFYFGKCNGRSLNAGTYIGYVCDLLEIIPKICKLNTTQSEDDQIIMTKYCNVHPDEIYIDTNNELFLTIVDNLNDLDNHVHIENRILSYNNNRPFFIHAAYYGYLDKIIPQLGYSYADNIKDQLYADFTKNKIMVYLQMAISQNIYFILFLGGLVIICLRMKYFRTHYIYYGRKRKVL